MYVAVIEISSESRLCEVVTIIILQWMVSADSHCDIGILWPCKEALMLDEKYSADTFMPSLN